LLRRMTWRLPDTYHSAGTRRGTATLKFYEGRDILNGIAIPMKVGILAPPCLTSGANIRNRPQGMTTQPVSVTTTGHPRVQRL